MDGEVVCPADGCKYTSSEQGVKIHYGRSHPGTISGTIVECDNCGEETRRHSYRLDRSDSLFCSPECKAEHMQDNWDDKYNGPFEGGPMEVDCAICGDTVHRKASSVESQENHVCGPECFQELMSGENSPRWSGGRTREPFYISARWKQRREEILERDGRTCARCGERNDTMNVHHITPISEGGPKLEADNLVTLCVPCHRHVHGSPERNSELIKVNSNR